MKSLVYGCAAAALLMGLAVQARAEIVVQSSPVHTVPADDEADEIADAIAAAPPEAAPAAKVEPAPVRALVQSKAPPPAPILTPDENAFFAALGERVTDAASAYEVYVRKAGAIDPAFSGAASVQRAVKAGAAYHPVQLEEGIVAYAALIALRNPGFVDGVRAIQNPAFADDLIAHPERVLQVRGAPDAASDVAGVLQAQGEALIASGKAVTKAAYDIQVQSWSKSPVADPKAVLEGAKSSAGQMRAANVPSKEKLLASLVTAPQTGGSGSSTAPEVVRGVALAALAILGRTGDGSEARYEALMHDVSLDECLKLAKMNLNQCLASAGPHYEDVYCAGRHAVADTGRCIAAAADAPADAVAPAPRLQEAERIGPEQAAAYGRKATAVPEDDDDDDVAPPAAPRIVAAAPAPAPAPRQYAEAPRPAPQYAEPPPEPQRADPMPDPRLARQAPPAYALPPQGYSYAQNDYAPPQAYAQQPATQYQPQYPPQYQQQPYPQSQYAPPPYPQQQYAQQQAYPPQAYAQQRQAYPPQGYAQQPYYPPAGYYGR